MYVLESSVGGGHVGRACVCVGEDEELKPDGVGRITDKRTEAADGGVAWSINVVRTSNVKPADAGGRRRTVEKNHGSVSVVVVTSLVAVSGINVTVPSRSTKLVLLPIDYSLYQRLRRTLLNKPSLDYPRCCSVLRPTSVYRDRVRST